MPVLGGEVDISPIERQSIDRICHWQKLMCCGHMGARIVSHVQMPALAIVVVIGEPGQKIEVIRFADRTITQDPVESIPAGSQNEIAMGLAGASLQGEGGFYERLVSAEISDERADGRLVLPECFLSAVEIILIQLKIDTCTQMPEWIDLLHQCRMDGKREFFGIIFSILIFSSRAVTVDYGSRIRPIRFRTIPVEQSEYIRFELSPVSTQLDHIGAAHVDMDLIRFAVVYVVQIAGRRVIEAPVFQ